MGKAQKRVPRASIGSPDLSQRTIYRKGIKKEWSSSIICRGAAEVQRFEDSQKVAETRTLQVAQPRLPPPPVRGQRRSSSSPTDCVRPAATVAGFRSGKREDPEPATEQEVSESLADGQVNKITALMAGKRSEAARVSGIITNVSRRAAFHSQQHGEMISAFPPASMDCVVFVRLPI